MKLEVATLVARKGTPSSHGFVDSLDPLLVVWSLGGRDDRSRWSQPELCSPDDLEESDCPGCGETECWCGVGR